MRRLSAARLRRGRPWVPERVAPTCPPGNYSQAVAHRVTAPPHRDDPRCRAGAASHCATETPACQRIRPRDSEPIFLDDPDRQSFRRTLGEHGIQEDSPERRIQFQQRMELRRSEGEVPERSAVLRRSWRLGACPGRKHELARERETNTERAERRVRDRFDALDWTEQSWAQQPKGYPEKLHLARQLRRRTPMMRHWIGRRLGIGSPSYPSDPLGQAGEDAPDHRRPRSDPC
jgi:hypothetical protein